MEDEAFSCSSTPSRARPTTPTSSLLKTLELKRADVEPLAVGGSCERLLSEAMRQAETSGPVVQPPQRLPPEERAQAVDRLTVVEADDPRQEARRRRRRCRKQEFERPGEMAALVTPDRDLALAGWFRKWRFWVAVDDSAGTALAEAPVGRLASPYRPGGGGGVGAGAAVRPAQPPRALASTPS